MKRIRNEITVNEKKIMVEMTLRRAVRDNTGSIIESDPGKINAEEVNDKEMCHDTIDLLAYEGPRTNHVAAAKMVFSVVRPVKGETDNETHDSAATSSNAIDSAAAILYRETLKPNKFNHPYASLVTVESIEMTPGYENIKDEFVKELKKLATSVFQPRYFVEDAQ